ncbi:MAG TPA: 30S ribosomal protein S6 [Candidatus Nanoarchaeia archaeon]|nr:30S ribosomal protein S6 [Candidatus Nanoarchaeia archaeon]
MSKVKKLESAHYELLFIIPNKFTEDEAKAIDAKIKQQIAAAGGEVTYAEDWGKKKLAYPIGGYNHGYYKLAEFDLAGEKLAELDNFLRLSNDVLRHQIIRAPKRTAEQIAADKKKSDELAAIRKRLKEGGAEKKELAEEKTSGLVTEKKPPAVEERKSFKKKTELKDLDAKLDDILDTKDLI